MATIIDIKLPKAIASALRIPQNDPQRQQLRVLKKLLRKSRFTEFGQHYLFDEILFSNDMLDKIAAGKLNAFFKEHTLLQQAFVKDSSKTVADYLKDVNSDLKVTEFKRVALG